MIFIICKLIGLYWGNNQFPPELSFRTMKTVFLLKKNKMLKKSMDFLITCVCIYTNKCAHISLYAFITMHECVSAKKANARAFWESFCGFLYVSSLQFLTQLLFAKPLLLMRTGKLESVSKLNLEKQHLGKQSFCL